MEQTDRLAVDQTGTCQSWQCAEGKRTERLWCPEDASWSRTFTK